MENRLLCRLREGLSTRNQNGKKFNFRLFPSSTVESFIVLNLHSPPITMILSTPGQKRILLNYKREEVKKKSSQNGAKGRLEEIFAAFTILGVRDMSVCVSICLPLSVLSIVSQQSCEMVAWN